MKGIQFVVDEHGRKTAVLIDLAEWGELWEDFYDGLVAESRRSEPTISLDELEARLNLRGDRHG